MPKPDQFRWESDDDYAVRLERWCDVVALAVANEQYGQALSRWVRQHDLEQAAQRARAHAESAANCAACEQLRLDSDGDDQGAVAVGLV